MTGRNYHVLAEVCPLWVISSHWKQIFITLNALIEQIEQLLHFKINIFLYCWPPWVYPCIHTVIHMAVNLPIDRTNMLDGQGREEILSTWFGNVSSWSTNPCTHICNFKRHKPRNQVTIYIFFIWSQRGSVRIYTIDAQYFSFQLIYFLYLKKIRVKHSDFNWTTKKSWRQ